MEKILVNLLKIGLFITMNNKTERHIIANTIFLILWGIIMIFASSGCAYFSRTKKSSSSEKFHYTIPKPAQEIPEPDHLGLYVFLTNERYCIGSTGIGVNRVWGYYKCCQLVHMFLSKLFQCPRKARRYHFK